MPGEWPPDFDLPGNLVTFRVLEPYAVKVESTVLRRERRDNPPDLYDVHNTVISNAQARVWQLATATSNLTAKHMLFCLH
jgi:hypothetical protein